MFRQVLSVAWLSEMGGQSGFFLPLYRFLKKGLKRVPFLWPQKVTLFSQICFIYHEKYLMKQKKVAKKAVFLMYSTLIADVEVTVTCHQ